jgi:hypothetical protein
VSAIQEADQDQEPRVVTAMIVEFLVLKVSMLDMIFIFKVFNQHPGLVLAHCPALGLELRLEAISFDTSLEYFELDD